MTAPIPFLDLKAQQARIAADLRRRIDAVLAHCQFILGPEVRAFETALASTYAAQEDVHIVPATSSVPSSPAMYNAKMTVRVPDEKPSASMVSTRRLR